MASNFQSVSPYSFFHDEGNGKQKQVISQNHGEQSAIFDDNKVDEFYGSQFAYLQTWIEKFTNTASGLEIAHCMKLYLNIAKYEPLKGSSYIPLPEASANKKAIINLKNDDNKCLEWALLSALYHDSNNPSKISSFKKHLGVLNMDGIDFPTPISQILRVEKKNNLAITVYGATVSSKLKNINVFPYHISEQPNERQRINLLLLSEDAAENQTKYHYCWIKNLNRLLYGQNKHKCKTYFCDRCLYGFTKEDLLIQHKEDCFGINKNSTKINMPTEGKNHITFKNHQNQMPVPYVIYADFESIIKPKTEKAGDKSELTSEHEACGFGYQVVRCDGKASKPVIFRGENVVEVFLNHLECEVSNINNIFAHPKPLIMKEQDKIAYEKATHCWICEQK